MPSQRGHSGRAPSPHVVGVQSIFRRFASASAGAVGSPWAFIIASASVITWALLGKTFKFSDTWQLVINTGTTIVTFLMVFLIQNTQNRDAKAIHLKLDELIRGTLGARDRLLHLEDCSDKEIEQFEEEFRRLRERVRDRSHEKSADPARK